MRILICPAISIFIDIEIESIIILIFGVILILAEINIQPKMYVYLLMSPFLLMLNCNVKFFNIVCSMYLYVSTHIFIHVYIH